MGPHGGEVSQPRLAHGKSAREGRSVVVTLLGADAAVGKGEFFFAIDGLSGDTGAKSRECPCNPDLDGKVFCLRQESAIDVDVDRREDVVWKEILSRALPGGRPMEAIRGGDRNPDCFCVYCGAGSDTRDGKGKSNRKLLLVAACERGEMMGWTGIKVEMDRGGSNRGRRILTS